MPITNFGYGRNNEKKLSSWEILKGRRIIDVGGGKEKHIADKFQFITAVADLLPPPSQSKSGDLKWFSGDLNLPEVWAEILEYVEVEGLFDFAICTHTLEDLRNPLLTAKMLPRIAKAGLVTFPSINAEARKFELFGSYRGWRHHRWLHRAVVAEDGTPRILAIPKLALFEGKHFSRLASWKELEEELWFEWDSDLPYELFQNDHLGPDEWSFYENYTEQILGRPLRFSLLMKTASTVRAQLMKKIGSSRGRATTRFNLPTPH